LVEPELETADEATCAKYREYVEALCSINNVVGLRAKAYACYGNGNRAYACDWRSSEECLLKLMELDNDFWAANSLGYIYYYGRTTNGVPDYDRSFKYFSVAALYGIHEAIYKLADLCLKGQGVPMRCLEGAEHILSWLYNEQLRPLFLQGSFDCKLADVSLRLGNLELTKALEHNLPTDNAYWYFVEAKYALERRAELHYYGDASVAAAIEKGLETAREGLSYRTMGRKALEKLAVHRLWDYLDGRCAMTLKRKGNRAVLTIKFPKDNWLRTLGQLIVIPELDYCHFSVKEKVVFTGVQRVKLYTRKKCFYSSNYYEQDGWLVFEDVQGNILCKIKADGYRIKRKKEAAGKALVE